MNMFWILSKERLYVYIWHVWTSLSISARLRHLREAANFLLQKANLVNSLRVEQHWSVRFLQQNSQFFKRKQTSLVADRKTSLTVEMTKQHFYDFRDVLIKYAIQSNDIWNMNESDFRIKVERDHLVITLIKKKSLRAIDSRVRNLVSDVKMINAHCFRNQHFEQMSAEKWSEWRSIACYYWIRIFEWWKDLWLTEALRFS